MGVRLAEEFRIERLNLFVFVRLTLRLACVLVIERLCAFCLEVDIGKGGCVNDGSTAAGYAAAGTAHNLDKLNVYLTCLNIIKKLSCVSSSTCYCNKSDRSHVVL